MLGYKYTLFLFLSICFCLFSKSMASTPELGCERWNLETQKCFMNNLFVLNQNQANCHHWQLFGRWCGGNLLWRPVCLLWWSLREVNPPTRLAPGSRVAGGQVIQRLCVTGSSLLPPRLGECANFVTDSLVWLPCSALLKSPCPETIHHIPSTCLQAQAGRTGYRNVKDHFWRLGILKETIIRHHRTTFTRFGAFWGKRLGWWETPWIYIAVRNFKRGVWHLNGLVVGASAGVFVAMQGEPRKVGTHTAGICMQTACPVYEAHRLP